VTLACLRFEDLVLMALAIASVARQRVILLACGSFNPPTIMHLRMFELARDYLNTLGVYQVVGGVISPVHDAYGKKGLAPAKHRLEMLQLALKGNNWVKLSNWEADKNDHWSRTRQVLEYHQRSINCAVDSNSPSCPTTKEPWLPEDLDSGSSPVTCKLLCGADVLESFNTPGIWQPPDMDYIAKEHGIVAITRAGNNPYKSIHVCDPLFNNMRNIHVVTEWISNEISSTEVRRAFRRNLSIRYVVPDAVTEYMEKHNLYRE